MLNQIDTHIHALPPAYTAAVEAAGGDPAGFPSPKWSIDATIGLMNHVGTSVGIVSVSAPGVPIAGHGEAGRALARSLNTYLGEHTTKDRDNRLGFFGVLPDWQDVEGTLHEIDFLYEQQKLCFGITLFTTYGGKLPSDPVFKPIWRKLQAHKVLVFLHPTTLDVSPKFIASVIPQPILDYPLATTRTAVDLVLSGTLQANPDIDVILSHAGGTLPFISDRIEGTLQVPAVADLMPVDQAAVKSGFARFYHDVALSTGSTQLRGLLDFADPSHILFGSDFPYCPRTLIDRQSDAYARFMAGDARGWMVAPEILRTNAMGLLKKHAQNQKLNWDFVVSVAGSK
ncbi:hypothetical protein ACHAQA_006270 [Verticillium albo-atrum]